MEVLLLVYNNSQEITWCVLVTANLFDTRYCSSVNKEGVSFQGHDIL